MMQHDYLNHYFTTINTYIDIMSFRSYGMQTDSGGRGPGGGGGGGGRKGSNNPLARVDVFL